MNRELDKGLVTLLLMLRGSHFGQESEDIYTHCNTDTELHALQVPGFTGKQVEH